jgi:osmotically-inducible protein OsmY
VVAVANDIEVRLILINRRPDPEIARDVVSALKTQLSHNWESIQVVVKGGWVTLGGEVEWDYQRDRAEQACQRIRGVKGITNRITLRPSVAPENIRLMIEEALQRAAEIDANNITVEANGGEATLRGSIRSWAEMREAECAARSAPGVTKVDNRISIIE